MKKLLSLIVTLGMLGTLALAEAPRDTFVLQTLPGGPVSLDPARAYDSASGIIIQNVYETLYTYDGESIDVFVPLLATGYTTSDDGLTWNFDLREGVQFHSGNTMTCKDVEWSYEYGMVVAHPEGAGVYLAGDPLIGQHTTDGSDPAAYQELVDFATIDGAVECPDGPDGLTVQFNFQMPEPAFIAIQAYGAFSIIDSQYAIENGMWDGTEATWVDWIGRDITQEFLHSNMSGTGAYKLVSSDNQQTIAERFDDYWGGAPALKNAVVQYVDEQSSRILALQQGDADEVSINERSELVKLRGAEGVSVLEDPNWGTTGNTIVFFTFDVDTENNEDVGCGELGCGIPSNFFDDVNVRRGFAHLFDQQAFIDQLYEGNGSVVTMGLPPGFMGYNADIDVRTLDFEAAEEAFRAAHGGAVWENGFEFTAIHNAGNTTRQTALEIIAENLAFVHPDFKMNVRSLPWADFLARTAEQKVPMFALGWGADYADPKNFIDVYYSNAGFYSARTAIDLPEIQELIDQANSTSDQAEREALYKAVGPLHYDLAPLIVLPQQNPFMTVRSDLQGVYRNAMLSSGNRYLWKDVSK